MSHQDLSLHADVGGTRRTVTRRLMERWDVANALTSCPNDLPRKTGSCCLDLQSPSIISGFTLVCPHGSPVKPDAASIGCLNPFLKSAICVSRIASPMLQPRKFAIHVRFSGDSGYSGDAAVIGYARTAVEKSRCCPSAKPWA